MELLLFLNKRMYLIPLGVESRYTLYTQYLYVVRRPTTISKSRCRTTRNWNISNCSAVLAKNVKRFGRTSVRFVVRARINRVWIQIKYRCFIYRTATTFVPSRSTYRKTIGACDAFEIKWTMNKMRLCREALIEAREKKINCT